MEDSGYVCPNWAKNYWSREDCAIEKTTVEGVYVVLDHNLQTVIFKGTRQECDEFLGYSYPE